MLNPLVELVLRLIRLVHIPCHSTLHESSSMVDSRVDHSILDCFRDDVLRIFLGVKMKLDADICKGDTRVGEGDGTEGSFDDEVA